jgi:hypothetical protein
MNTRANELAQRLKAFNDTVLALLKSTSAEEWRRRCDSEAWSVGVVARHMGATHYRIVELAKLIVAGQPLPEVTEEMILARNEVQASKHAQCTKEEVTAILESNGRALVDFVAGLSEADLDRGAHLPAFGGEITVGRLLKAIVLKSGGEHLESLQRTLARRG